MSKLTKIIIAAGSFFSVIIIAISLAVIFSMDTSEVLKNNNIQKVSKNLKASAIDCGVSKSGVDEKDYEKDSAFVCLGNAILDDCKHAKFILGVGGYMGEVDFEVKKEGQKCFGTIEFNDEEEIRKDRQLKYFANKNIKCPLDLESFNREYRVLKTDPKLTDSPGELAYVAYYKVAMEFLMNRIETECTGSFKEVIVKPVGMPTPEEALVYAADAIEKGDIDDALKMYSIGEHH